jgi:hypothetical protein
MSLTLTSAPLTGAAKIEPTIVDEVVGVSEVGDAVEVLSLELLQAASVPTEQATNAFNIKFLLFKVFHHLQLYKTKSVLRFIAKTMPVNNYNKLHHSRPFGFVNKSDRLCDITQWLTRLARISHQGTR